MTDSAPNPKSGITAVLDDVSGGRDGAFAELIELVYSDLHGIAQRRLSDRSAPDSIHATELVSETVVRLLEQRSTWDNRQHFFAIATRLMLRVIVDRQRMRLAIKRGGGEKPVALDNANTLADLSQMPELRGDESLRLSAALSELHESNPRAAEIVTLYLVGNFPLPKIAELLDVSLSTVEREWKSAKSQLFEALGEAIERSV